MKKILMLFAVVLFFNTACDAKDYAKIQLKELKKSQKYDATEKYYADYSKQDSVDLGFEIKDPKLIKLQGYEFVSPDKLKAKYAEDSLKYMQIKKRALR